MSRAPAQPRQPLAVHTVGQPTALHGLARLLLQMHLQAQAQHGLQLVQAVPADQPTHITSGAAA